MVFSARRLMLAALLVVGAVIWVRINKPVEGDVLLELTSRHGVTTADLLSLVMLAMALVIAWPSRRPPRPPSSGAAPVGWTGPPRESSPYRDPSAHGQARTRRSHTWSG
ncbi:hypothetical protein [Actinomycetospora chibensis]|uniref:Uncharacterized protein n=1 Tax=Actinomycetospora chibensis TaxID=663606 RepID=A0ABV9RJL9_9PSEU|nr:hypothetical protein [Actinomycetospora chibensis]MDD7923294.1 hypothetical protein [Actinomycetospora chibensis]